MITEPDQEAKLLFSMVMKLGGESNYSESQKSEIMAECQRSAELRNQALIYLCGSSERSDLNLYRLHTMIAEKFFPEEVA